jgi:hypothetical protein
MNGMIGCVATDHWLYKEIIDRRERVLLSWPAFQKEASQFQIAEIIERSDTDLRDDFVPWAPGMVVASDYLLRAAGHYPGACRPQGWSRQSDGLFRKPLHRWYLTVSRCGEFWLIEREIEEVLVYHYGSLPVVTRSYQAAMRLAEYCHLRPSDSELYHGRPRGAASNLSWAVSTPDGVRY